MTAWQHGERSKIADGLGKAAIAIGLCLTGVASAVSPSRAESVLDFSFKRSGDPRQGLPAGYEVIDHFGERPVFSPDGKRIAFIGKTNGDAFEYDIARGTVRNLTGHTPHNGFRRVHYLADGNFLLVGSKSDAPGVDRLIAAEIFFLSKDAAGPIRPLGASIWEGLATSRYTNKIAWVEIDPKISMVEFTPGKEVIYAVKVAEVAVRNGRPTLHGVRDLARFDALKECMVEAQDFRNNDSELMVPCYKIKPETLAYAKSDTPRFLTTYADGKSVIGIDLKSGARRTYFATSEYYAELEAVAPDGKWALLECGRNDRQGLDLCRIDLSKTPAAVSRVTFAQDYGSYRFNNPSISPDGRWIALQMANASHTAGSGSGIFIIRAQR